MTHIHDVTTCSITLLDYTFVPFGVRTEIFASGLVCNHFLFRYKIDGKLVFIRMLKNKHVMVRVGGGWDTLANYLLKHDCQKMVKIPTPTR